MNTKVDPKEVGRRLRSLRGIRKRTGVAKELGISYSALTQYEYGLKSPNDLTKVLLANYYNVPIQKLFFDQEYDETT